MNRRRVLLNLIAESRVGRRSFIVLLYIFLLGLFLYLPLVTDYFLPPTSLYVYGFTDMFHPESIAAFERTHKVQVVLRYFESNEELFAKFQINRGAGYDVIVSSDYMVEHLRKAGLLRELDKASLASFHQLDPRLLNKSYDPGNTYTVPFSWIPYGIIFHKDVFKEQPHEIGLYLLLEDPSLCNQGIKYPYRICMTDDAREALFLSSLYLYGDIASWDKARLNEEQALLIKQKKWVESYVNQDLAYPLLSGVIKAAFAPLFAVDKVLKTSADFTFMIPKEGSLYAIENLGIPKLSKQAELAHKFIDFMISKQEAGRMSNYYGMNPSNREAYSLLRAEVIQNKHMFPDDEIFARLYLTPNEIPTKACEEVWLAVKSS